MSRVIYTFLLWLALPLILCKLWFRSLREPGYARNWNQRFGRYSDAIARPVIWVHAVSVGEVRASAPLVRALVAAYPTYAVLVTCMTAAGRDAVEQVYGSSVLAGFLPYDYPFAMRRFLEHFRPRIGILMETEIWINLLAECRARKLPVVLANGRMSQHSARGYRRLAGLTRPAFERLAVVCAQSDADATRFAMLGAHHVRVAGNLKFDVQPEQAQVQAGAAFQASLRGRNVLVFASSREGEEILLLDKFKGRLPQSVLLIVVPRHPQRFEEVADLIKANGWSLARRSRNESPAGTQVLLGDTMGEMPFYYAASNVAMIGGSFLPFGGQNLIEAIAVGTPVVIGPHVHNFSEVARLSVEAGAAVQVADVGEAVSTVLALLGTSERQIEMGRAGVALCALHRGATASHFAVIEGLLSP